MKNNSNNKTFVGLVCMRYWFHSNFNHFHLLVASSQFGSILYTDVFAIEFYTYFSGFIFRRISLFGMHSSPPILISIDLTLLRWFEFAFPTKTKFIRQAESEAMQTTEYSLVVIGIPETCSICLSLLVIKFMFDACFPIIQFCTKFSFSGFELWNVKFYQTPISNTDSTNLLQKAIFNGERKNIEKLHHRNPKCVLFFLWIKIPDIHVQRSNLLKLIQNKWNRKNSIRWEFKNGSNFYPTRNPKHTGSRDLISSEAKKKNQNSILKQKKMWKLTCSWRILKFFQNQSIRFPFFQTFLIFPKWLMAKRNGEKPRYLWHQTNSVQYITYFEMIQISDCINRPLTSKHRFQFILTICIWVSSNQC